MKKVMVICIALIGFINAKSQVYLLGGANFANITKNGSGNTEKNNILSTFNAGFIFRASLYSPVQIESGLVVMGEGAQAQTYFSSNTSDNYIKSHFNPIYLQLPINAVISFSVQKHIGVFVEAGPYVQVGIGGRSTLESKFSGVTTTSEEKIRFDNYANFSSTPQGAANYNKLKSFDFGANVGAGLDIGKALLKVNYGLGFTKINASDPNNSSDEKNKYRTLSLSVGFKLGK